MAIPLITIVFILSYAIASPIRQPQPDQRQTVNARIVEALKRRQSERRN